MNTTATTIDSYVGQARESRSIGDGMFRRMVLKRLESLETGALTVHENGEVFHYGNPAQDGLSAVLKVESPAFYRRLALGGTIGAAEAFMQGWWTTPDLTALIRLFARNLDAADGLEKRSARIGSAMAKLFHRFRRNSRTGSRRNIGAHYDLSNDFFSLFLDQSMTYSSAVFEDPGISLEEAQVAKYERLCSKINLRPGDHVLEIGTGWGGFAIHAARNYDCRVTTTTISKEQYDLAVERVREAGLSDRIEILLCDYRDLEGSYDKLVSIEMIEAVGHEYLEEYFRCCSDLLRPEGQMALQVITIADQRYEQLRRTTDFIQRYIFPGSLLPSIEMMSRCVARVTDLRMTHLDDMTPHYAQTLKLWRERFHNRLDDVRALGYGEEFIRMWDYYLSYCEAGFAERCTGSVQLVLSKPACDTASIYAGTFVDREQSRT